MMDDNENIGNHDDDFHHSYDFWDPRNNDLELTFAITTNQNIEDLENNAVVNTICFTPTTNHINVDYSRFYNHIRVRSQLRKLTFQDDSKQFDFSQFLISASENSSMQEIEIDCSTVYSNQALGRFLLHPQLKKICIREIDEGGLDGTEMVKQIIETCPQLQHVKITSAVFTVEYFKPIVEALYKVKPRIVLELASGVMDREATALLKQFLYENQNPVCF